MVQTVFRVILFCFIVPSFFGGTSLAQGYVDSLVSFPKTISTPPPSLNLSDSAYLRAVALDTYKYFENARDKETGLIADHIVVDKRTASNYTSITNIGLSMLATIAAEKLSFISRETAIARIDSTLHALQSMERYKNFHYNWYNLPSLRQTGSFISVVDAGWLYSSLRFVELEYKNEAAGKLAAEIRKPVDFTWLYVDKIHAFNLGFDTKLDSLTPYHYELLCSEARIAFYYAALSGTLPPEAWFQLKRTLSESIEQEQKPLGKEKEISGVRFFGGYYTYNKIPVVPSWGGSTFEFLMTDMLIDEKHKLPNSIGLNNANVVEVHRSFALDSLRLPVWGFSPSSAPDGTYQEFGVPAIGTMKGGYQPGIVSPHASIIGLQYDPEAVIKNMKNLQSLYNMYGEYGFYDCVDPVTGEVGHSYYALNQAMILISLANYLLDGYFLNMYNSDSSLNPVFDVISQEKFFE